MKKDDIPHLTLCGIYMCSLYILNMEGISLYKENTCLGIFRNLFSSKSFHVS